MRTPSRRTLSIASCLTLLAACQPAAPAHPPYVQATAGRVRPAPPRMVEAPEDAPSPLVTSEPPKADAATYTPSNEQQAIAQRLAGSILVGGHAFDYLRDLSDLYGARLTGSPAYARAAAWAAESFKKAGVESVTFEEVSLEAGWERKEATARIVAPIDRPLHVIASAWSPGTPAEGVKGEVYVLKDADPAFIRAHAGDIKGKIILVDTAAFRKGDKPRWNLIAHAPEELKKAGALASLSYGAREGQAIMAGGGGRAGHMVAPLPRAGMGREDALLLQRLAEKGPVTITLTNPSVVTGPVKTPNVVAEIRGREKPDEWVLVGAHFDSWDLASGTQDNGSGSVQVMEAARAIEALGIKPRRSIRFVLYCGEEQGLHGSQAYAAAHAAELDKAAFVLNADYGAGAPKGWNVNGREDEQKALQPLATSLLAGLGGDAFTTKMRCDTDDCSFMVRGVPTANLDVDTSKYGDIHHLASDTLDKVTRANLDAGAAVLAVTAYALADSPTRVSPRLDHGTVKAHLEKGEMLEDVVASGMWK